MTFLDEKLDRIYLVENVEKGLSQLKRKGASIVEAINTGNLFKARTMLNSLPDASLDELMQVAHKGKNFHKYHLESKKMVKGDKSEMQKVFVLMRASLKVMGEHVKDKAPIDKMLNEVEAFAKKYSSILVNEGFTLASLMSIIGIAFRNIPNVSKVTLFGMRTGIVILFFGILLYVIRIILNTYFSLKGIK